MRLKKRDIITVWLKERAITSDDEGNDIVSYSDDAKEVVMNVQSATDKISAQIYGESLPYVKTCKYQGDEIKPERDEKSGVCLYVSKDSEPDYEIIAIQPFKTHLNITLKKRGVENGGRD